MATINKLKGTAVTKAERRGYLNDGGGLYLRVSGSRAKSWVFRFRDTAGRLHEMGLGPLSTYSLAEARERARECRKLRDSGIDPIEERRTKRLEVKLATARSMTFRQCAETYIKAHQAGWKNAKHARQWPTTLDRYVYPAFGELPVQLVDTALVMKALAPIWSTTPETAARVRGRIESILGWATTSGYRQGDNPARWRGHLKNLLPARSKVRAVEHHAALPYAEIAAFMRELRQQQSVAARALEFAILTAARTGEVIGAKWGEIDDTERLWTVPAERMKAGKEHRVPLSDAALAVIDQMKTICDGDFVFPGLNPGRPLSASAMPKLLARMNQTGMTVHGTRSSFRDWVAERTSFSHEVAEMALAHAVGDAVERAYRRGDLFRKRRQLMDAWAKFCATPAPAGQVVALRRAP
jgi:integrase